MIHLVRFNQDVWLHGTYSDHGPGIKFHSKGDRYVATDLYKSDLERDGVKFDVLDSMTNEAHKELLMGIKAKRMGLVAKGGV